jgi:glyoxylase-like metal-dependent hydrolase (beta-lactamase superfamily II)
MLDVDLWSIPVPIPANPLRYVLVYVICGNHGLTLIDSGWESEESWQALNAGLATLGATVADVEGVLLTHQHYDHIGLARRIQDSSGAWVGMHPEDLRAITHEEYRNPSLSAAADIEWLISLGASMEEARRLRGDLAAQDPRSRVVIPDRIIVDGQRLDLGGRVLHAMHTPGHTPGHLCFTEERTRLFFSGDHVLPRISPNISADRRANMDALGDYLDSLDKVGSLQAAEILPAHEWRFHGMPERVRELQEHHQHRLEELVSVVGRHPGVTPWDLAGQMTWSRPWEQYDGYMRIAAVEETMSHLVHLIKRGVLVASEANVPRYRLATAPPAGRAHE